MADPAVAGLPVINTDHARRCSGGRALDTSAGTSLRQETALSHRRLGEGQTQPSGTQEAYRKADRLLSNSARVWMARSLRKPAGVHEGVAPGGSSSSAQWSASNISRAIRRAISRSRSLPLP